MTSVKSRGLSAQSAKVLLSQLYLVWATEQESVKQIRHVVQELLTAVRDPSWYRTGDRADPVAPSPVNGVRKASPTKAAGSAGGVPRYADPTPLSLSAASDGGLHPTSSGPAGLVSPAPTTPLSSHPIRSPRREEEAWVGFGPHARLVGAVDEVDTPHPHGGVAGAMTGSPARPLVDPKVPLPQQHAGHSSPTLGSPTAEPGGGLGASPAFGSPAPAASASPGFVGAGHGSGHFEGSRQEGVEKLTPAGEATGLETGVLRESSAGRVVRHAGTFAPLPPSNVRRATLEQIPVFYSKKESKGILDGVAATERERLGEILEKYNAGKLVLKSQFGDLSVNVFKVPLWYKDALFKANCVFANVPVTSESLTAAHVSRFYHEKMGPLTSSRRLYELIRGAVEEDEDYLTLDDLKEMVKCLVASHPGLEFLQQPEFQEYYCRTVAIRIMYALERQQCRKVYWRDFDRSDLPEVMMKLDNKDVNQVLEYFSYEHFYVLYCKFWELDTDRDLFINYSDLCNYGQGSIVPSVIMRVIEGYGRPLTSTVPGHLDFEDFVYFCLSEEDKNSEPAVYYWFKVLDVDADGILSGHELFLFYKENQQRFLEYSDSPDGDLAYEDLMCQMLDMVGFDRVKSRKFGLTIGDLRACPTPANFLNMIFNAAKFLLFEHRDPFVEHHQKLKPEKTDWDRFARAEYDRMAAEAQ